MALSDFLIHTITINRNSGSTHDAVGGQIIASQSTLHTTIPACVQPVSADTQMFAGSYQFKLDVLIYTDRDISDVQIGDLVYFGSDIYTVQGVRNLMMNGIVYEIKGYRY